MAGLIIRSARSDRTSCIIVRRQSTQDFFWISTGYNPLVPLRHYLVPIDSFNTSTLPRTPTQWRYPRTASLRTRVPPAIAMPSFHDKQYSGATTTPYVIRKNHEKKAETVLHLYRALPLPGSVNDMCSNFQVIRYDNDLLFLLYYN